MSEKLQWGALNAYESIPAIRRIQATDLIAALRAGMADFAANRTDVIFLCLLYPVVGLLLARAAVGQGLLPLLFPIAAGFALLAPIAAIGLNEMSRLREQGHPASWRAPFAILRSPAIGPIAALSATLATLFLLWLAAANELYVLTLGPEEPASVSAFAHQLFQTSPGWTLIVTGILVGFLFALLALAISVVSFPLLLDRRARTMTAIETSIRVLRTNPGPMALWAFIIAAGLFLGSLPALIGLAFVLPVLGHATWHLYRRVVV